jgi:uroporphyrinogen III methyltransferase / synthase
MDSLPLRGKRIVITRPRAQAAAFSAELERLGAEVLQAPTIRIEPFPDRGPLHAAAREVEEFDWVVFTSVNGVSHFWSALREIGRDSQALRGVSVCAIGPATGAALEAEGVRPNLIPPRFVAESVMDALSAEAELLGLRILLPRAEIARPVLPDRLRAAGAEVVEVAAYRTVPDVSETATLRARLREDAVDVITFTSSSTVHNLVDLVGTDVGRALMASIGPITSAAARRRGLAVHIEAAEYTIPGLVRALVSHFGGFQR